MALMPDPDGAADVDGDTTLGTVLLESLLRCADLRYLSGEAFTGCSYEFNDRSGIDEDRLIKDPGREPMTESSFAEELSEDDAVDVDVD